MFGIRRRKSPGQRARAELNEGIGHLMQAATHAATGVGATVGPRVNTARGYVVPAATKVRDRASNGWEATMTTLAPLATAAREGARQAGVTARKTNVKAIRMNQKKKQRRGGRMMTGLLVAGAVAGVAGAMAMRRHQRNHHQWEEYDAAQSLSPVSDDIERMVGESPAMGDRPTAGSPADKARQAGSRVGDEIAAKANSLAASAKPAAAKANEKAEGMLGGSVTGGSVAKPSPAKPSGNSRP